MSGAPSASIGDLTLRMEPGFACSKVHLVADGIPHLRPFNVGRDGRLNLREVYQIPLSAVPRGRGTLSAGEILFNNTNSDDLVGKSALIEEAMTAGFSNHMTRVVVDTKRAEPGYVAYALDRLWQSGYFRRICTRWVSQSAVNTKALAEVQIPLPALEEQRRIVDILDRAASIRMLRRQAQETARQIVPALFNKMFGDPVTNPMGWPVAPLETVANVASGVTKGRRLDGVEVVDVPYMRVANVQDGYLDLGEVKTIPLRPSEVERFRLLPGDMLMTEGGDPDKLGRGAIWIGQIPCCTHQNHVFRVRADRRRILPHFLACLSGSAYGKGYFLRVAKRTTGIASINKTQLSAFPVPLPPVALQEEFERRVEDLTRLSGRQKVAELACDAATLAIQSRLFIA